MSATRKKAPPMMRLLVLEFGMQLHDREQREEPSGRCQYFGQTPFGVPSTVGHPCGHREHASVSDMKEMMNANF
jgi:hypothetical protein